MTTLPHKEEVAEKTNRASAPVREYIASPEFIDAFTDICAAHQLHLDEAEQLNRALGAVFVGLRPAAEFPELLRVALEQNKAAYDSVLNDVNEKIFVPFRRKLATPPPPTHTPNPVPISRPSISPMTQQMGQPTMKSAEHIDVSTLRKEMPTTPPPSAPSMPPPTPPSNIPQPRKIDPYKEPIDDIEK